MNYKVSLFSINTHIIFYLKFIADNNKQTATALFTRFIYRFIVIG